MMVTMTTIMMMMLLTIIMVMMMMMLMRMMMMMMMMMMAVVVVMITMMMKGRCWCGCWGGGGRCRCWGGGCWGGRPMPRDRKHTLCEPAKSKCTWTYHRTHFVQKFTGKMPDASDTTSIEHRPLTVAARTPQCGHSVWGKKKDTRSDSASSLCQDLGRRGSL